MGILLKDLYLLIFFTRAVGVLPKVMRYGYGNDAPRQKKTSLGCYVIVKKGVAEN